MGGGCDGRRDRTSSIDCREVDNPRLLASANGPNQEKHGIKERIAMQARKTFLLFLLVVLGATCRAASVEHSVILPPDQAKAMLKQCSRPTPEYEGAWVIPPNVIAQLEQDLHKLAEMKAKQCCTSGASVNAPEEFVRQYVGITIRGRKYVYINAFPAGMLTEYRKDPDLWKRKPAMVCDGGSAFWGALYDPETRLFSGLAFNGLA